MLLLLFCFAVVDVVDDDVDIIVFVVVVDDDVDIIVFVVVLSQKPFMKSLVKSVSVINEMLLLLLLLLLL